MFGISKEEAICIAQEEVRALHKRLGNRLFGDMGQDCLNLFTEDHRFRDIGLLGRLQTENNQLKTVINQHEVLISDLCEAVDKLEKKGKLIKKPIIKKKSKGRR